MHLLGHVRRGVVHNDSVPPGGVHRLDANTVARPTRALSVSDGFSCVRQGPNPALTLGALIDGPLLGYALVTGGTRLRRNRGQRLLQVAAAQLHIDKARPGDVGRFDHVECRRRQGIDDLLGHVTRLLPQPLGQPHRGVRLIVAKLRNARRLDQRIGPSGRLAKGSLQGL